MTAININTIITNFQRLYPANNDQIWTQLKQDNSSLTDEIIGQLDINFTEQTITITAKSTSTDYTGSVSINSYQYNLYVEINGYSYYVYDFNQFCSTSGTFNVRTNVGDKTFSISDDISIMEFIQDPSINFINNNFLRNCNKINTSISIPEGITSIRDYFLSYCILFNQPLTLPNSLISIGNYFMYECESFNQPLTLPNSITSIGNSFMYRCMVFNQPLAIPNSATSIGNSFMYNVSKMTNTINFGNLTADILLPSDQSFSTLWSNVPRAYTEGIKIKGSHANEIKNLFPDRNIQPYRKLIIVPTSFIAKETSLSYKYHLNLVLGEHDIKVYLVKENEVSMKFDKPITTILPDTSTGKLLIGNALKNLPQDQLTETAIETKITAINFYNK